MFKLRNPKKMKKSITKAKQWGKRLLWLLAILVVLWIVTVIFAPRETEYVDTAKGSIANLELPAYAKSDKLVEHTGYTLLYSEKDEQPYWVAYYLDRSELYGSFDRGDDFRADPAIATGSATLDDYKSSGFDRGHLIPAADQSWSEQAMSESFFLSNMSPQDPQFNRGIWSKLEATVRNFADTEGGVYVVTGPVLTDGPFKTIGEDKVSVPNTYYKVILDYREPDTKAIGFLLPNKGSNKSLQSFAVSVDEVEKTTGLDFFPKLPDQQEEVLEAQVDAKAWDFNTFSASAKDREAFQASLDAPKTTKSKPNGIYSFAKGTMDTILGMVKRQTTNIIELFLPKETSKKVLAFLY